MSEHVIISLDGSKWRPAHACCELWPPTTAYAPAAGFEGFPPATATAFPGFPPTIATAFPEDTVAEAEAACWEPLPLGEDDLEGVSGDVEYVGVPEVEGVSGVVEYVGDPEVVA